MRVKQKLMYMTLGGVLVLAGYILASFANDSVAQSGVQDVTFGKITCSSLDVVDNDGKVGVVLRNDKLGGGVYAFGKDGKSSAALYNDEYGGGVGAFGKGGGKASLRNTEYGGSMSLFNKAAENVLQASVGDTGGGVIETRDKHGYRTGDLP